MTRPTPQLLRQITSTTSKTAQTTPITTNMSISNKLRSAASLTRGLGATGMKRNLATPSTAKALYTPVLPPHDPAALHLISGQSYEGQAFGAKKSVFGETVFSTSITSCECFEWLGSVGEWYLKRWERNVCAQTPNP